MKTRLLQELLLFSVPPPIFVNEDCSSVSFVPCPLYRFEPLWSPVFLLHVVTSVGRDGVELIGILFSVVLSDCTQHVSCYIEFGMKGRDSNLKLGLCLCGHSTCLEWKNGCRLSAYVITGKDCLREIGLTIASSHYQVISDSGRYCCFAWFVCHDINKAAVWCLCRLTPMMDHFL